MIDEEIEKTDTRRLENKRVVLRFENYEQKGYVLNFKNPAISAVEYEFD